MEEQGQSAPSFSNSTSKIYKSALETIVRRAQGESGIHPQELFRSRVIQSNADNGDLKTRGASGHRDLPGNRVPMIASSRPVLGVPLASDLVSSTTGIPATAPSSSSASSPITLKPPRIMPILASAESTSTSTDSPRTQPVATPSFSPCYLVDVEVQLKPGCADILLKDRVGVVRKVEGKTAMVHIKENPSYITIPHDALVPVTPKISDAVKVIGGNSSLVGLIGTLVSLMDGEGLVQFLSWSNQRPRNPAQISLSHLGRYSPLSKFGSNSDHSRSNSSPRPLSGDVSAKPSAMAAPRLMNVSGYNVIPVSTSRVGGTSTSSPLNGLPLSFITPPSSKQPPAPSKPMPPAHISNLPSNLSSRPAVVDSMRVSDSPLTSSEHLYRRRNGHQGLSLSQFNEHGINGHQTLVQYGSNRFGPGPSFLGMVVDKDCLRNGKEKTTTSILLSKIAAMNKNGFVPVCRGGGPHDVDISEVLEKLVRNQRDYLYELTTPLTPGGGDVKASRVRVSLICPLGQQRMKYPSRGRSCKHLQCFDAENYISFHRKLILRNRMKQQRSPVNKPVPLDKTWTCPICEKMAHLQHLYIDKALMKLVQETDANEVELKDDGTWAPVAKNAENDVIDLTGDD